MAILEPFLTLVVGVCAVATVWVLGLAQPWTRLVSEGKAGFGKEEGLALVLAFTVGSSLEVLAEAAMDKVNQLPWVDTIVHSKGDGVRRALSGSKSLANALAELESEPGDAGKWMIKNLDKRVRQWIPEWAHADAVSALTHCRDSSWTMESRERDARGCLQLYYAAVNYCTTSTGRAGDILWLKRRSVFWRSLTMAVFLAWLAAAGRALRSRWEAHVPWSLGANRRWRMLLLVALLLTECLLAATHFDLLAFMGAFALGVLFDDRKSLESHPVEGEPSPERFMEFPYLATCTLLLVLMHRVWMEEDTEFSRTAIGTFASHVSATPR